MSNHSRITVWLVSIVVVFSFVTVAAAGVQTPLDTKTFNTLYEARGKTGHVRISNVPLADQERGTLELDRFEIYGKDSVVVVFGENGVTRMAPPKIAFFRGKVEGDPGSLAFVSISDQSVSGFVMTRDRKLFLTSRRSGGGPRQKDLAGMEVIVEEATPSDDYDAQGRFECKLDEGELSHHDLMKVMSGEYKAESVVSATAYYVANLAVDTDYELRVKLGSVAAVNTYIANLVAAASTIYHRDLRTDLYVKYQSAYDTAADPFAIVPLGNGTGLAGSPDTYDALVELGKLWHTAAAPRNITRSAAMLVSGKTFADAPGASAGVAWRDTLCLSDFAASSNNVSGGYGGSYGMLNGAGGTGVIPNPTANPNYVATTSIFDNNYWTLLAFTHELGHVVQSSHTHCIQLPTAPVNEQTLYGRTYVDNCYSGEGGGCYSNGSFAGGTNNVPTEKGTIMSYCHIPDCHTGSCTGGYGTSIRYTFGQAGEASHVIPDAMKARLNTVTPALSAITAPVSVTPSSTGNVASISAVGGATYSWIITNGTITSSSTTNSITFTAGSSGSVGLQVFLIGSNGCGATDTASITIAGAPACSYTVTPAISTFTPGGGTSTISVTAGVGCVWSAVSNSAWITVTGGANGSGNGTVNISIATNLNPTNRTGSLTIAGQTVNLNQNRWVRGDMNGDGFADIVWRNTSTGVVRAWLLDAAGHLSSTVNIGTITDQGWVIGGIADFNRDGFQDLLWRHLTTGDNNIWYMQTTVLSSSVAIQKAPNANWQIRSVNDMDNNGWPDVVLRNVATGQNVIWQMTGASITGTSWLATTPNLNWIMCGSGDVDNNGSKDVVWRNQSNGDDVIWIMNGFTQTGSSWLTTVNDLTWKIAGVADYNYDGTSDLIWRYNGGSGAVNIWFMQNGQLSSSTTAGFEPDTNWQIAGPR